MFGNLFKELRLRIHAEFGDPARRDLNVEIPLHVGRGAGRRLLLPLALP